MAPRSLRTAGLALAVASASTAVPPAADAASGTTVATVSRPTTISGYGTTLAYSAWDGEAFRLTFWDATAGTTTTADVPGRSVPFDVDLGPDAAGRTVAVYSRCRTDPYDDADFARRRWSYVDGKACDVYRLPVGGGGESRVAAASDERYSEVLPTIWRSRVTFVRVPKGWTGNSVPQVRTTTGASTTSRAVAGVAPSGTRPVPTKLDSYGSRIASAWTLVPDRCSGPGEPSGEHQGTELRTQTIAGRQRTTVNRFCVQDRDPSTQLTRPTIGAGGLVSLATTFAADGTTSAAVARARVGAPKDAGPVAAVTCVDDVAQLRDATAVVDQNGAPCPADPQSFTIRTLP